MKSTLTVSFLFIISCFARLQAQSDTIASAEAKTLTLVGINITSTLAGFFNSGGQDVPKDPFLFSLKFWRNNRLWRLGINFKVINSKEELDFGGFRKVKESEFLLRIGREWQRPISKRFTLYYGVDAVGSYLQEQSRFDFSGSLTSQEDRVGFGAGPFLGVYFNLGNRVWLSTETYAYGIFYFGESTTEIGPGIPDESTRLRQLSILPAVPNSLYIHFSF